MIEAIVFVGLLNIVSAGRNGYELGDLFRGSSSNNHGVKGVVSVLNEATFYIANFTYDGKAPDAYFWVGKTAQPSPEGIIVPDELGTEMPLKRYENKNIIISLPENLKISDIKWLSIWCRAFTVNFGFVTIPDEFVVPAPKPLPALRGRAHKVSSGGIVLIDSKTIQINSLYYDGNGPDAFFLVGTNGSPNGNGIKVPDEKGRRSRLRRYNGEAIVLRLPDPHTWFDIKWFAMYCIMAQQNFGEVYINRPLNIPIDLASLQQTEGSPTLTNCKEIFKDRLLVRWLIMDEDVYIQLEGRTRYKEYLAFGISGSEDVAQMIDADVVVAYYDNTKSTVVADDYYLTQKAQCAGGQGACPDVNQGGRQNIVVADWKYESGIVSVTYKRRLESTEDTDKPIHANISTTVVAAIGLINSKMEAAIHSTVTRDLIKIEFGKDAEKCDSLKVIAEPKPTVKPWPPLKISNETIFTAQIGPTGGDRGYTAITGEVGWGIAWWINGLLFPEITVKRGVNYTFIVEGGNDASNSAQYHPLYITNDNQGGGSYSDLTKPEHKVYAGVEVDESGNFVPIGAGRYCAYESESIDDQAAKFDTFEEFKQTLTLQCENGSSAEFTWTPDGNTPDLVYYQCFTHKNLGWKIHVTGLAPPAFVFAKWISACFLCNLCFVLRNKLFGIK